MPVAGEDERICDSSRCTGMRCGFTLIRPFRFCLFLVALGSDGGGLFDGEGVSLLAVGEEFPLRLELRLRRGGDGDGDVVRLVVSRVAGAGLRPFGFGALLFVDTGDFPLLLED